MPGSTRERHSREITMELLRASVLDATRLEDARREFLESSSPDFGAFLQDRGLIDTQLRQAACGSEAGIVVGDRYELLKQVGRGGWGRVYRALDARSGAIVAVKLLDLAGLEAQGGAAMARKRFEREASVGLMFDHPNVVRTMDVGPHEDSLYLAMELVEGFTLEQVLLDGPLEKLEAIRIASEALDGLAHVHAAGLVHRDVKARNIMVTAGGATKVMDFGLAVGATFAKLTRVGTIVGTPHYMAPEQILAQEVDARTDTYAMGVTLYQLLCGQLPFEGREGMAVLYAILQEDPPPIERVVSGIGETLGMVVRRAMRRDKVRRYQTAAAFRDDLRHLLAGTERFDAGTQSLAAPELPEPPPVASVTPGREPGIAAIRDGLRGAVRHKRAALYLSGEAGIGKSRMCESAVEMARAMGLTVFRGSCSSAGGGYSYRPVVDAIRGLLAERGIGGEADLGRFVSGQAPELEPVLPMLKLVLMMGGGEAASFGREQVFASLARLLEALGRRGALLVLEDVQWIDEGTLGLLEHVIATDGEGGILVLLTGRPEELRAATAWEQLRLELSRRDLLRELPLPRLPREGVAAIVREVFPSADDTLVRRIHQESEGNPLYAVELAKLSARDEELPEERSHGSEALPQKIRELVLRRLNALPMQEREVLELAAVVGNRFDAEPLATALQTTRLGLLKSLQRIEREHRLIHADPAGGYRFDHGKVREVLYQELARDLRVEYHRLLAEGIEARGTPDGPAALLLADHLLAAGERRRAAPYLRQAAAAMLQKQDLPGARLRYEVLLSIHAPGDPGRHEIIDALADLYGSLGEHRKASAMLAAALAEAESASDAGLVATLRLKLGVSLYYSGDLAEAEAALATTMADARAAGHRELELVALGNLGNIHYVRGEWEQALACYRQLTSGELPGMEATARNNIGNTLARMGRSREAVRELRNALGASRADAARDQEAVTLRNLGVCLYERRHFRRAILLLERAEKTAEEIGFAFLLSWLWPYLGAAHVRAGSGREALRIIEKGVALALRQASREHHAEALCCKGEALAHLGDREEALAAFTEAERIATVAGIAPLAARAARGTSSVGRSE